MTRKIGRPTRASEASTERVEIRLTRVERQSWEREAAKAGTSVSEWIRSCATSWLQYERNRLAGWK